ncbi:MAG TPA: polysaccharide ABC transporter ATP-binding protein [Alphaproteobacteria bacterium]
MSAVIEIKNLGKKYTISPNMQTDQAHHYLSLRESITNSVRGLFGFQNAHEPSLPDTDFWALRHIDLTVEQGDRVGIIGSNGAGKSTLLKMISRITYPTEGEIRYKGRIASLLEVGTGFHPELTGRENIYLIGAILGMSHAEIRRKFDEIVDFAGIEKFLDTPVKRYSSGMYTRLAFSVAAHLESEILIVDEVLAVGDTEFQKKCLGKMEEIGQKEGKTLLFVSHNMDSVLQLTNKVLFLDKGKAVSYGVTDGVVNTYLEKSLVVESRFVRPQKLETSHFQEVEITTSQKGNYHIHGQPFALTTKVCLSEKVEKLGVSFQIANYNGKNINYCWFFDDSQEYEPGTYEFTCHIPSLRLMMGKYYFKMHLANVKTKEKLDFVEHVCPFEVGMDTFHEWTWHSNVAVYLDDFSWSKNDL